MNFSFESKFFSFSKIGKVGCIWIGDKLVFAGSGNAFILNAFGREFTNVRKTNDH